MFAEPRWAVAQIDATLQTIAPAQVLADPRGIYLAIVLSVPTELTDTRIAQLIPEGNKRLVTPAGNGLYIASSTVDIFARRGRFNAAT